MKKKFTTLCILAFITLFVSNVFAADQVRIALLVKALGIGFFEAAQEGADEAAKQLGNTEIIYTGPTSTTAEGQIEIINALIAQHVDAIAVSADSKDALVPALKKAQRRGIKVISWDSGVSKEGRQIHIDPSSSVLIGHMCDKLAMDAIEAKGETSGKFAILSATPTSTNQNNWIKEMKKSLKDFPNLQLVDTVYGEDLADKSYREAKALVKNHPDLDVIVAPTTVGLLATAQAVSDLGLTSKVYVTGLGLPSELSGHVHNGTIHSFTIWNPIDLGYVAAMVSYDLVKGIGSKTEMPIGRMGMLHIGRNGISAMSEPFVYDASNVDKFSSIF